jgi:hypothetical protein
MPRSGQKRAGTRKRRKANRGSFRPGFDPRRHVFTPGDCRLGYWVVMLQLTPRTKDPVVREWVRQRVAIHNRAKDERRARDGSTEERGR